MKRRSWFIGGAAVLLLAALLAWAFAPRPLEVEVAEVTLGAFETTLDEDARTRLRERFVVSAPLAGRLSRIALREGDAVRAGEVVATLVPALSPMLDERTQREQQARVQAGAANLQRASTRIGAARVALEQATVELRRTEQLAAQGFVAPTQTDASRLAAQAAQMDLDTAVQGERVAQHELVQARAALQAARGANPGAGFALRAPVAGRVLKVHHTSELTVAPGAPLLEIGDTAALEVVAELLTTDALLARPGSAVRIERWGGAVELQGRVRRVEPGAFTKVSALGVEEQRVNVLIDIVSAPEQWAGLGDAYRVGVRIVTRNLDAVLRAPVSAVFPQAQGADQAAGGDAVFVVENGRARLQPVSVGARNASQAWIRSGLQAGQQVIVYPPAAVREGTRVRVRAV